MGRDESGQTTVEYLMISGFVTAMAIYLLDVAEIDDQFQSLLQQLIGLVVDPPY
tara:strand:- start:752 stop:913 length:162 start_codon:yes stop_codon:yes gene_type:complete